MSTKDSAEGQSDVEVSDGSFKVMKTQWTFRLSSYGVVRYMIYLSHHKIIRYPRFSIYTEPELYFRKLLILFYPRLSADYELVKEGFQIFREAILSITLVVGRHICKDEHKSGCFERALAERAAEDCEEPISIGYRIAPKFTQFDDGDLMNGDQLLTQQQKSGEVDCLLKKTSRHL